MNLYIFCKNIFILSESVRPLVCGILYHDLSREPHPGGQINYKIKRLMRGECSG